MWTFTQQTGFVAWNVHNICKGGLTAIQIVNLNFQGFTDVTECAMENVENRHQRQTDKCRTVLVTKSDSKRV
jgi:hypothetical protein